MVNCNLRWSRIEFSLISSCHLFAVASVVRADAWVLLELVMALAVLVSFLNYLRDRFRTFYELRRGRLLPLQPALLLAQQFARIDYNGRVYETALPSVIYMSEFLLVLSLRCAPAKGSALKVMLVLWPDSLTRSEECRLRRYLRFELSSNLDDG